MKYKLIKFIQAYGEDFYQVRLQRGWFRWWLKDAEGEVRRFPTKEEAHRAASALWEPRSPVAPVGSR